MGPSLFPNDKSLSDACFYDFTARLLCPLLLSQLQVYESEQRASWAQALGRLCPTLKTQVHDGCSILISWEGAQGCRGAGILWAPASPLSTLLFPLITRSQWGLLGEKEEMQFLPCIYKRS